MYHMNAVAIIVAKPITLNSALERGIRIMGSICGWVILFKICLCFFDHWVMRLFPSEVKYILYGFTELANGCWLLTSLKNESLRFVLCNCFLSFGGLCVIMQTSSVTPSNSFCSSCLARRSRVRTVALGSERILPISSVV